jgi:hypothetical protein
MLLTYLLLTSRASLTRPAADLILFTAPAPALLPPHRCCC